MRKTNILKVAVCTVMFTLMLGTTVLAGTISDSDYVRGKATYSNSYTGAHGHYTASGTSTAARTTAINESDATRFFYCTVTRFNWEDMEYDYTSQFANTLTNGESKIREIPRNKDATMYDYFHNAQAFETTTTNSPKIDDFSYTAMQYYR